MAATKLTDKLTNIADAIRGKTGGTDALTLDGMVEAIAGIEAGGGDTSAEDGLVTRTLTEYSNGRVTSIGNYAFYNYSNLSSASFPQATSIGDYTFQNCSNLSSANFPLATSISSYAFSVCSKLPTASFPQATSIGNFAFQNCSKLTSASFPQATSIGDYAFTNCSKLPTASFPQATSIGNYTFSGCYSLTALIIEQADRVCTLSNTTAFRNCYHILGTVNSTYNPEGLKDGYIYVPDALVEDYKAATNWSTYADQIKPLSEYTG